MRAPRRNQTTTTGARPSVRRLIAGAGWGAVATVVMSALMLAGTAAGLSPMPKPVPAALIGHTLGPMPEPVMLALAVLAHLGYGASAGALLTALASRVTIWGGAGYGAALWAVMGLAWLPYLGWGLFGIAVTVRIAAATLVLHLVYGLTLGLLLDRRRTDQPTTNSP